MKKRNCLQSFCIYMLVTLFAISWSEIVRAQNLETMDRELGKSTTRVNDTEWVNAKMLTIEGMGWSEGVTDYTRLPDKFKTSVTSKVWSLSRHSAGLAVRFKVKGTTTLNARWNLTKNNYMAHMTPQGTNGLDLYVKLNGKWCWAGIGKPSKDGLEQEALLKAGFLKDREYECMVYLPLYTGVSSVEIGVSKGAVIRTAGTSPNKPLVFYGTSILHGCSASRGGMTFAAMLGRKFDRPAVNLGFSGNGQMDEPFGDILGEIEASIYFIDCLPNMSAFSVSEITNRTLTLVRKLHAKRPSIPIVLVEDRTYAYPDLTGTAVVNHRRQGMEAAYKVLKKEIKGLYYVKGDQLLGDDNEATVDGSHPSDLGMYRYYKALAPVASKLLK